MTVGLHLKAFHIKHMNNIYYHNKYYFRIIQFIIKNHNYNFISIPSTYFSIQTFIDFINTLDTIMITIFLQINRELSLYDNKFELTRDKKRRWCLFEMKTNITLLLWLQTHIRQTNKIFKRLYFK